MTLTSGTRLGPYEVLAPLDVGGMGEVYRARDPRIGRDVAVKILPPSFASDRERLQRFELEARTAGTLNHPSLLTILDVGQENGTHYLVSELLEGETLRTRLLGGPLSPRRAMDYAIQIAHGLAAAHEKGITHRDIKPENIFVTSDGRVKILDFGLAKVSPEMLSETSLLTQPRQVMGTVAYMSPEQARGERVDPRSDIFSFGVVLYEMLTGSKPFDGPSAADTITAILTAEPSEIRNVSPALSRIVTKCLEKHAEARFHSAADLAFHLEQISEISDLRAMPPVRPRGLLWLIGAALIIIAAVVLFFRPRARPVAAQIQSIAVLPFENATGHRDLEYLSDGFSEELIDKLSELPNIRVIARTTSFAFKGKPLDLQKIAQQLDVDAVVVGKLTVRGSDTALQTDLVDVKSGAELWGRRYSASNGDSLQIENRLADDLGRRLRGAASVVVASTVNQAAYDEYLRGRHDLSLRTYDSLQSAASHFRNAIKLDPKFALGFSGLAEADAIFATNLEPLNREDILGESEEAARTALRLDPQLAEAHADVANIEQARWHVRAAADGFRQAIALDPNLVVAHHWLSLNYVGSGELQNARHEIELARRLDPLSPMVWTLSGFIDWYLHDDHAAAAHAAGALAIAPDFSPAEVINGFLAEERGDYPEAERWFRRSLQKPVMAGLGDACLAALYGRTGRIKEAEAILDRLNRPGNGRQTSPIMFSHALLGLGKRSEAMDWLERGVKDRDFLTFVLYRDRFVEELSKDPRYQALIRRVDSEFAAQ